MTGKIAGNRKWHILQAKTGDAFCLSPRLISEQISKSPCSSSHDVSPILGSPVETIRIASYCSAIRFSLSFPRVLISSLVFGGFGDRIAFHAHNLSTALSHQRSVTPAALCFYISTYSELIKSVPHRLTLPSHHLIPRSRFSRERIIGSSFATFCRLAFGKNLLNRFDEEGRPPGAGCRCLIHGGEEDLGITYRCSFAFIARIRTRSRSSAKTSPSATPLSSPARTAARSASSCAPSMGALLRV